MKRKKNKHNDCSWDNNARITDYIYYSAEKKSGTKKCGNRKTLLLIIFLHVPRFKVRLSRSFVRKKNRAKIYTTYIQWAKIAHSVNAMIYEL